MILTKSQGERLTRMLAAMRPEFDTNGIARILQKANQDGGLPGHNFDHAIRAAAHYATQTNTEGFYAKHTPAMYPATGQHWDQTAPPGSRHKKHQEPPCEEHSGENARTCTCCWADIKLGERPENMLGKRLTPKTKPTTKPINWGEAFETIGHEEKPSTVAVATRGVAPF